MITSNGLAAIRLDRVLRSRERQPAGAVVVDNALENLRRLARLRGRRRVSRPRHSRPQRDRVAVADGLGCRLGGRRRVRVDRPACRPGRWRLEHFALSESVRRRLDVTPCEERLADIAQRGAHRHLVRLRLVSIQRLDATLERCDDRVVHNQHLRNGSYDASCATAYQEKTRRSFKVWAILLPDDSDELDLLHRRITL